MLISRYLFLLDLLYLFLLVWIVDCVKLRNVRPQKTNSNRKAGEPEESGATHSIWSRFVHIYMLLIIISATIIFEDGPIRYISLITLALLALIFCFFTQMESDWVPPTWRCFQKSKILDSKLNVGHFLRSCDKFRAFPGRSESWNGGWHSIGINGKSSLFEWVALID